jgi:hypothetical protein
MTSFTTLIESAANLILFFPHYYICLFPTASVNLHLRLRVAAQSRMSPWSLPTSLLEAAWLTTQQ